CSQQLDVENRFQIPLAMTQQSFRWMAGWKTLGHAAQLLAFETAQPAAQLLVAQDLIEFLMMLGQQGAVGQNLVAVRAIHPTEGQQLLLGEVKIEDGALTLHRGMTREDGSDVSFVRRFVG